MPQPTTELLIGPPASGKTTRLLQIIQDYRASRPLPAVRVLLPDDSQVFAFQRRLAASGALGVRLSTFGGLHRHLLSLAGRLLPEAGGPALYRVIQALARQEAAAGRLAHYAAIVETPGFINAMAERFAELKRERVLPERFLQAADPQSPGETELARLYDRYQLYLQEQAWADREGLAWLAVELLEEDPSFRPDFELLLLDGFNEFTPVQVALLDRLQPHLSRIVVTLTGRDGPARSAHGRFNRARQKLATALQPEFIFLDDPPRLTPELASLEAGFFEPTPHPYPHPPDALHLLELRSPAEEAREALRWIKALLLRGPGLQPQQTAVFSPDIDLHLPYLKAAAAEFGLPLHVRFREPLASAPEIHTLANLLELPAAGYLRRPLLECLRSPLFDFSAIGFQPQDAVVLEALSYEYQVVGGLEQWRQAFARHLPRTGQAEEITTDDDERGDEFFIPSLPDAAETERLASAFEQFTGRLQPQAAQTLSGWVGWLEDLLGELGFQTACPAEVQQALGIVLDQLLLSEELLRAGHSAASIGYTQFLQEFLAALQGQGLPPGSAPQDQGVFVGPLIEARGLRFEAVALLGLGEGLFPQVERADPFLGEDLRGRLGMETRLGRYQSSLFYQAALRTNRHLLLTRPYLAEGGEAWQPSPYWQSTAEVFPGWAARLRPADPRRAENAASIAERLHWQARAGSLDGPDPVGAVSNARLTALRHKTMVLAARLAHQPSGPYEGQPYSLVEALARRYGPDYVWSASRFEAYGGCPQRFYVQQALDLEPLLPPRPGFEPVHLGSILHELLEEAYRTAQDPAQVDSVVAQLHRLAPAVFARAPEKYGFRPGPLWEIEQTQLLALLEENILALADSDADWQPAYFEARFGLDDQPPLELETEAGTIRLRGLIDRVDTRPGGSLRVIDYKTGGSHLAARDLLDGVRLQLPLYAAAARALGLGEPVDGFYWHLGRAEAGRLKLSSFSAEGYPDGVDGALQVASDHIQASLEGIRQAEFTPQPPPGGCPGYCPAAAWCWHYQPSAW